MDPLYAHQLDPKTINVLPYCFIFSFALFAKMFSTSVQTHFIPNYSRRHEERRIFKYDNNTVTSNKGKNNETQFLSTIRHQLAPVWLLHQHKHAPATLLTVKDIDFTLAGEFRKKNTKYFNQTTDFYATGLLFQPSHSA